MIRMPPRTPWIDRVAASRDRAVLTRFAVRALVDQRIDPLARVALGQFHRRLDRQIGPGLVDGDPDPVVAASVAPTCAAFMNTIRCVGSPGLSGP